MVTLKVLCVDDELGMRQGILRTLHDCVMDIPEIDEQVGFEVTLAETGEEAVVRVQNERPDILLLDYKLPGITGLEVLNQVEEKSGQMLTIMITAYASIETAITATKRGAYDFLPKPFTPADLKHKVRKAVTRIILTRRARELEEANKRVRFDFIRVLGHELKAPISSIYSYLHIMHDHILGTDIGPYDEMVSRCLIRLEQMRKLILDLLDMTRIESGQKSRERVSVDVNKAVSQAVELVQADADDRDIHIHVDVEASSRIMGDTTEIDMILNNLTSNAVKYNRDGGEVHIRISRQEDEVVIEVRDTGIGMTAEEKDRLFGEFVRIRNSKTQNILGSGLGLSILKKLVDLYRGRIAVESEPDRGTTFTVTLIDADRPAGPEKQEDTHGHG
jgi:signal transduction histidine kinase